MNDSVNDSVNGGVNEGVHMSRSAIVEGGVVIDIDKFEIRRKIKLMLKKFSETLYIVCI